MERKKLLISLICYSLLFITLRVLTSPTFTLDESEQYYLSQFDFAWGYPRQAPLYTWLIKLWGKFFPVNLVSLTVFKFILISAFYWFFYDTYNYYQKNFSKFILQRSSDLKNETALSSGYVLNPFEVTLALSTVPLYSVVFITDLTHTVLACLCAVALLNLVLRLIVKPTWLNYVWLGVIISAGLLAKYNFVLFMLSILLAAIMCAPARRALLNPKILLSVVCAIVICAPHLLWLYQDHFSALTYVAETSEISSNTTMLTYFKLIFLKYLNQLYIFLALLAYILVKNKSAVSSNFSEVSKSALCGLSSDNKEDLKLSIEFVESFLSRIITYFKNNFISLIALINLILPIILLACMGASKFQARWGALVYFTVILAVCCELKVSPLVLAGFSRLKKHKKSSVYFVCILMLIIAMSFRILPVRLKVKHISAPFKEIATRLKQTNTFINPDKKIYSLHRHTAANLTYYGLPVLVYNSIDKAYTKDQRKLNSLVSTKQANFYQQESFYLVWNVKRFGFKPDAAIKLARTCTNYKPKLGFKKQQRILKQRYYYSEKIFKLAILECRR